MGAEDFHFNSIGNGSTPEEVDAFFAALAGVAPDYWTKNPADGVDNDELPPPEKDGAQAE
jgi:hypothetical protein